MLMRLKNRITGMVVAGTVMLPPGLHYAAEGYLEAERYMAGVAYHWKLEALRYVGLQPVPSKASIDDMIDEAARKYGLRPELLHAVVQVESRKNPTALSNKGAMGLGQVLPSNAKRCGLPHHGYLFVEAQNLDCSAKILSEEIKTYGNVPDALRCYNGGPKAIKGKFPESEAYVVKVMAEMGKLVSK